MDGTEKTANQPSIFLFIFRFRLIGCEDGWLIRFNREQGGAREIGELLCGQLEIELEMRGKTEWAIRLGDRWGGELPATRDQFSSFFSWSLLGSIEGGNGESEMKGGNHGNRIDFDSLFLTSFLLAGIGWPRGLTKMRTDSNWAGEVGEPIFSEEADFGSRGTTSMVPYLGKNHSSPYLDC